MWIETKDQQKMKSVFCLDSVIRWDQTQLSDRWDQS